MGGFSKKGLARLGEVVSRHTSRGSTPGAVVLVSRGSEVHVETAGDTGGGAAVPVRRDTIFRISSMTKPVTAAAVMTLVEDCVIRLDDPVDELLPELADRRVLVDPEGPLDRNVPARRPITVRDLLTFRMGLGIVMAAPGQVPLADAMAELELGQGPPNPAVPPPPDEWMRRLGSLPLAHQPGERWMYNTGADVLGVLLSRASGLPLEEFLRERLFDPLEMVDTGFHVPAGSLDRFGPQLGSDPVTGQTVTTDPPDGQWSTPPAFPSGGAGLVSTVDDYHAFARMLASGGLAPSGERVLSRSSVELMTTDHLTPEQKALGGLGPDFFADQGWGFGLAVTTRRTTLKPIGSYGWDGGLGSSYTHAPTADLTVLVMTPRMWPSPTPPPLFADVLTTALAALDD